MKKILAILLAAVLALSLAACGGNDDTKKPDTSEPDSQNSADAEQPGGEQVSADDALALLNAVWDSYSEEDKFPVAGGDMSEENMSMDGPGKFGIEDTASLESTLVFPEASVDKIEDAASLVHMMNANTFTCGVFHVKDAADVTAVVEALRENLRQRQWICGFPEQLVIATVGDYVVSFFGTTDLVGTFKTNLTAVYSSAEIIYDEALSDEALM